MIITRVVKIVYSTKIITNLQLKAPDRAAFVRVHYLITDKHTEILVCIPSVMVLLLHSASRAQISRSQVKRFRSQSVNKQTDGRTDGRTDATKRIISLASQSIIISYEPFHAKTCLKVFIVAPLSHTALCLTALHL